MPKSKTCDRLAVFVFTNLNIASRYKVINRSLLALGPAMWLGHGGFLKSARLQNYLGHLTAVGAPFISRARFQKLQMLNAASLQLACWLLLEHRSNQLATKNSCTGTCALSWKSLWLVFGFRIMDSIDLLDLLGREGEEASRDGPGVGRPEVGDAVGGSGGRQHHRPHQAGWRHGGQETKGQRNDPG